MLNFCEEKYLETERNGLRNVSRIEEVVDHLCERGYSNLFFVGIGGTIAYAQQIETIVKTRSNLMLFAENAADLVTLGHKKFNKDSIMVIESISGDTPEIVRAVEKAHEIGATVIGFVEKEDSPLAKSVDFLIQSVGGAYCFWYTVALRFMKNAGEFEEYDRFFQCLQNIPEALCQVKKDVDKKAQEFAQKYKDEPIHYLVGAGNLSAWAYCYAMCIMEEMQWIRTKYVSAPEFFHGTLEVIDRDTSVILFKGEDEARPQIDRVEKFVNRVSAKVSVFDTKDFELAGIDKEFRGLVSPFVMRALCQRISKHLEFERRHPLEIRRYYRHINY